MHIIYLLWYMHCVSETQTLPPVQVFDKTMVVKQLHVLEPQDLLITRADKGRLRPQEGGGGGSCLTPPPCTSETASPETILCHPLTHFFFFFFLHQLQQRTVFTAHLVSHYSRPSLLFHLCHLSLCCWVHTYPFHLHWPSEHIDLSLWSKEADL